MHILLIGSGGREHALCWKLSQSSSVDQILVAPGNPGTAAVPKSRNVPLGGEDLKALVSFASTEGVDLTVVGPEKPLAEGIVDLFRERDLRIFGPSREAARLESSKEFAKRLMADAGIPSASFEVLSSEAQAFDYVKRAPYPLVLKADGLAAGKGVSICPDRKTAETFVQDVMKNRVFGDAGKTVVAEEFLEGEEVSFLVLAHGTDYVPLVAAQDHKRLEEGERGPNTGGMGAYSPAPVFDSSVQKESEEKIVRPLLKILSSKRTPFTGVLYVGLMLTATGPKVLEFNVRFGDPETQVILPRLESDLAELLSAASCGRLRDHVPSWKTDAALTVVLASRGYPASPEAGRTVEGLDEAGREAIVFHSGTKREGARIVTAGGRVLSVTALGPTLAEASSRAYRAVDAIRYEGKTYRKDIGWRALRGTGEK
jgi:phosphoribosylamine---glycine ligase